MFPDLAKNLIMKEIAKKVAEVKPEAIVSAILKEAHGLTVELEKDADGDGVKELDEIKADLIVVGDKLGQVLQRLEAARQRATK